MWITFWRRFWGTVLGGFLEPTGPGAGVRGLFSAKGVPLVRWASADLVLFSTFFAFLDRFLPVFVPFFALFSSMSCAYLYVNNFFLASLACRLLRMFSPQRRGERRERQEWGERRNGETAQPSTQPRGPLSYMGRSQRPALSERLALSPSKGASRRDAEGDSGNREPGNRRPETGKGTAGRRAGAVGGRREGERACPRLGIL